MLLCFWVLSLAVLWDTASAGRPLPDVPLRLPEYFLGRHRHGLLRKPDQFYASNPKLAAGISGTATFQQRLNHYSDQENTTWGQRYFFNYQYYTGGRTNFLYLGGEGEESLLSATSQYFMPVLYAQQFAARLFVLEHRFYGQSQPFRDLTDHSLLYLTSKQALGDIAYFIEKQNAILGDDQQWVLFGGSYSGSLALWARELYPHLIVGAIGSSAPVQAQLDFFGYLGVVEADIVRDDQETGRTCASNVRDAFTSAAYLLQGAQAGRDALSTLFNLDPPFAETTLDENTLALFWSVLLAPFKNAAQYGIPQTMKQVCQIMTNATAEPVVMNRLRDLVNPTAGKNLISYGDTVLILNDTTFLLEPDTRAWTWQTCFEFGYFQSTDSGSNIFGSVQSSNLELNICKDVFGVTPDDIRQFVDNTNDYYGGNKFYTGTNVLITNGDADPWSYLGKTVSPHPSVVAFTIRGGHHCSDFFPDSSNEDIMNAQSLARINIDKWLNEPNNAGDRVNITDHTGERPPFPYAYKHLAPQSGHILQVNENERKESPPAILRKRSIFTGRSNYGLRPPPTDTKISQFDIITSTITQPLDHFDNTNGKTFEQKYYSNSQWATRNGPNFLMLGGEAPEPPKWVTQEDLAWLTYAKEVGAMVYDLEHRYYGDSKTGTNDLQYLTSAQALFDAAHFIDIMTKQSPSKGPWIVFGGSYSGALAAWAREWFPELIAGAVATSGPVEAKLDFYEYLKVVEKALTDWGKPCADNTREAFSSIRSLLFVDFGRAQVSTKFKLSPAWEATTNVSQVDIEQVFAALYGDFQGVVQYSDDNNVLGPMNVSELCKRMTQEGKSTIDMLADVHFWVAGDVNATLSSSYAADMNELKAMEGHLIDGTVNDDELAGLLWTWQTCNEFGYFQSTDYGTGLFGGVTPVNFYVKLCEDLFNVDVNKISDRIDQILYQYGGRRKFKGSNVVLPNGSHDPWSALGLYGHPDPSVVSILINGTAHCADMYPASASDLPSLTAARQTILENIKRWISGAPIPGQTTTTSTQSTTTNTYTGSSTTSTLSTGSTSTTTAVNNSPGTQSTSTSTTHSPPTTSQSASTFLTSILFFVGLLYL